MRADNQSKSALPFSLLSALAYAALLLAITYSLIGQTMSPHSTARLATIDSLVERGTFAMDGSPYAGTVDRVLIDGRYYSHQPPAMAVIGALVYYPLHALGMRIGPEHPLTYVLLTFVLNGLTALAGLAFFFKSLRWATLPQSLHLPLTASLACATVLLPFSATLNSHGFCAALIAIGWYFFLLSRESGTPNRTALCAGLAFALCASADHAMFVFFVLFGACMLLSSRRSDRVFWFYLPALFTLLPTFVYYYLIGHSFAPFAARPALFIYPGSQWVANGPAQIRLTGASWNSLPFAIGYGTEMLLGPRRGFLIFNPLAALALYGLVRCIRLRAKYWIEAAAVAAGSAIVIAYYSLTSANFSGATYSIRWFIPLLPLWWFFGSYAVENIASWTPWQKSGVLALSSLAVFYACAGSLNPWPYEWRGALVPLSNIREALVQYHVLRN